MLQARPLYDTEADGRFFVEPSGWDRLLNAVAHRFNVAVLAERGAGKTTVLRQLQRRLRQGQERVAYVDATDVEDVGELVAAIEREIVGDRGAIRGFREDLTTVAGAFTGGPPGGTSFRLVQRIRDFAEAPAMVILVDASHSAAAAHVLFGRLRDELWQLEHRWVVAVENTERTVLLTPPADAFFDQVVGLSLTPAAMTALLTARAPDLPAHIQRRVAETAPTARAALQAARDALTSPDPADPLAGALWRQEVATQLGRPQGMAMAELEALGGASASDKEFLRRMGWTRARAVQVLKELADHDLLIAVDEQSPSAGRPRRVYRPAPPPAGAAFAPHSTELPIPDE